MQDAKKPSDFPLPESEPKVPKPAPDLVEPELDSDMTKNLESFDFNLRRNIDTAIEKYGQKAVAEYLSKEEVWPALAENLSKFDQIDCTELALWLITEGFGETIFSYIDTHPDNIDTKTLGNELMSEEDGPLIDIILLARNIEKFPDVDQDELVVRLIEQEAFDTPADDEVLRHMHQLNATTTQKMMATRPELVLSNLEKFDSSVEHELVEILVARKQGKELLYRLDSFKEVDRQELIEQVLAGDPYAFLLVPYSELVDESRLADALLSKPKGAKSILKSLDYFEKLNGAQTSQIIRDVSPDYLKFVVDKPEQFTNINQQELFNRLLGDGQFQVLVEKVGFFDKLDSTKLADDLLLAAPGAMAEHMENFPSVYQQRVADELFEHDQLIPLLGNLEKFEDLSEKLLYDIIDRQIGELEDYSVLLLLSQHIESFDIKEWGPLIDHLTKAAANDVDLADSIVEHLVMYWDAGPANLYKLLDACSNHYSTAQKILQTDLEGDVRDGILSANDVAVLVEKISRLEPDFRDVKKSNPKAGKGIERIQSGEKLNPNARFANQLNALIRHPETADSAELKAMFEQIDRQIIDSYYALEDETARIYGADYARRLFGDTQQGLSVFENTYRRLVAEYLVLRLNDAGGQGILSNIESLSHSQVTNLNRFLQTQLDWLGAGLEDANNHFLQVLKVDVNYYNKLYLEWDHKREGSLDFEEVFLGRDGVYAYVGRVGQILARRQAVRLRGQDLGKTERQLLQMPTYLVYPRTFRDELNAETKAAYLTQGVHNPANASYYDTGFTGTIPVDIMNILGIPAEEQNRRIRLLSATNRERTIAGLKGDQSERNQIVNTIEYNVKPEESAAGLYQRELVPGQVELQPYASPTTPAERLSFRFVQQALYRHYFTAEAQRLSQEEFVMGVRDEPLRRGGDVVATMRVDQKLDATSIGQLHDIFAGPNVGEQLRQRADAIKIAGPEDPFPNEAVFELSLQTNNGTSRPVIVKAIIPEKTRGPLDEYAALRLLDSLGIESAKPIARVFLQGTGAGEGFIVMDKLPGVSGRNLDRQLDEAGLSVDEKGDLQSAINNEVDNIANTVRTQVGLDKPWNLGDFMIVFHYNDDGKPIGVEKVIPIDFEGVHVYSPNNNHFTDEYDEHGADEWEE